MQNENQNDKPDTSPDVKDGPYISSGFKMGNNVTSFWHLSGHLKNVSCAEYAQDNMVLH